VRIETNPQGKNTALRIPRLLQTKWTASILLASIPAQALVSQVLPSPGQQRAKISSFAPADDLIGQVDFYIGRLDEALADPENFDAAKQSRAWKDSNTLAVLALMLSAHDETHALKSSMRVMLKGAQAMAAADDSARRAGQGLATIKSARAGTAQPGDAIPWEKVASVPALMKQVPLVHAGLRRGVTPNRLKRMAKQSAGQSATLAAIAEAALLDDEYAKSPEEAARWSAFCVEMRDAAGEVNSAVRGSDQARVDAGMKRLLESCDACHAKFRQR
jgi:hypothetical protein